MFLAGAEALGEPIGASGEQIALRQETKARPAMVRAGLVNMGDSSSRLVYDFTPAGGAANIRPELGLPPVFSERMVMQSRQQVADGVALEHSTGLGLNRAGSSWRAFDFRGRAEEESLFYHDSGVELKLVPGLTLRLSSRLARQAAPDGTTRQDWSSGLVAAISPTETTTIYAGAFGSKELLSGGLSRIFTGGVDARLPGTSLTVSASRWAVLGTASAEEDEDYSSSGAAASLSWQLNEGIWQAFGVQREESDGWGWSYALWRCYVSTVFRTSATTSFGLELSYTQASEQQEQIAGPETKLAETRVRVSHSRQLLDNLTTEISLEWAIGGLTADAHGSHPALRIAGQFAF